jgi:hypothetical protein
MLQKGNSQKKDHQGRINRSGVSFLTFENTAHQVKGLRGSRTYSTPYSRRGWRLGSLSVFPGKSHRGYCRRNAKNLTQCLFLSSR